jgi:capsular exopolysaccharide synthesis family protein
MKFPILIKDRKKGSMASEHGSRQHEDAPLFHEQFKALRAKINDYLEKEGERTLAITSSIAEEGKTVTCVNLATHIASTGRKKVLLVDTDMRKCDVARGMNLNPFPGLNEFLSGTAKAKDILRNSMVPGLHVIPAGSELHSPADLLAGEEFRSFLKSAQETFDVIILDTPPVLPVADTLSLRDQIDRFLLVYRAGFTPYPMLRQVVEEIGEQKILGVVINRVKPMTDRYYKQYYGKYYRK